MCVRVRHPQLIEWSGDSKYVLCAMYHVQTVQVVPVDMADDWTCSMCEGAVAGLVRANTVVLGCACSCKGNVAGCHRTVRRSTLAGRPTPATC